MHDHPAGPLCCLLASLRRRPPPNSPPRCPRPAAQPTAPAGSAGLDLFIPNMPGASEAAPAATTPTTYADAGLQVGLAAGAGTLAGCCRDAVGVLRCPMTNWECSTPAPAGPVVPVSPLATLPPNLLARPHRVPFNASTHPSQDPRHQRHAQPLLVLRPPRHHDASLQGSGCSTCVDRCTACLLMSRPGIPFCLSPALPRPALAWHLKPPARRPATNRRGPARQGGL